MKRLLTITTCLFTCCLLKAQHPVTFITKAEAAAVKTGLSKYPLLRQSYDAIKKEVDPWIGKEIDVPVPKDPAGGYTHERHKANYMLMYNSALLYNLTGDIRYAQLVKKLFLKYAALNPTLGRHPQAKNDSAGHLFHQALNDVNWLVYTGMAYDGIYNTLSAAERKTIEDGAFKPEVDYIVEGIPYWFNQIHNHGVWANAAVGIVGLATGNEQYVQEALYGSMKGRKSGFIAQLDSLFSPDGYYTEGPYYVRYALLPFYVFANALNNARPQLNIFAYRNSILKKALEAGLQQTNTDGVFFPLNDALKEKDFTTGEMITSVDIAWNIYGADSGWLAVAKKQGRVALSGGGAGIAAALLAGVRVPAYFPYRSVAYTDGAHGNEGGLALLRAGNGKDNTTLIFKYTAQGLSHGHYDKLSFMLYDKGQEIFTDYGSARFVNIEAKDGGRYLPENKAYAVQTIAHNTLVADETSHFNAQLKESALYHPDKLFSHIGSGPVLVVSARDEHAYRDIMMNRTLFLLQLPGEENRYVVDFFQASSASAHQYDLPFQYSGQLMKTSFSYKAFTDSRQPLGRKNGYQFLWKEAEASVGAGMVQFTFLHDRTFYSLSSLADDSTRLLLARTGANDPQFNLRSEPSFIIRKKGAAQLFVNVIEIHGNFDPVSEVSTQADPQVKNIELLCNDADFTIARVTLGAKTLVLARCNKEMNAGAAHSFAGT
ncbi:MAG TPA: heparinase II/III family protein, partial [Chitinophagaceae bacterium]|nr:heparinase II/III family protein [Chitinophagaceae bacterium]